MNIINSLKWRYAVKKFDDKKLVSSTQINTLKEAFNLTATSFGLQPVKLIILKNKETQQQLVPHSFHQTQVGNASHLLVLAIPKTYGTKDIEQYFSLVKKIRNTPDAILNPFKNYLVADTSKKTSEELFEQNKRQAYLILGNLLTTCAIEKIDSCPMEGFDPKKYDEILQLNKQNLTTILLLPIGFRADDDYMKDLKKVRKNTKDVVIEIS